MFQASESQTPMDRVPSGLNLLINRKLWQTLAKSKQCLQASTHRGCKRTEGKTKIPLKILELRVFSFEVLQLLQLLLLLKLLLVDLCKTSNCASGLQTQADSNPWNLSSLVGKQREAVVRRLTQEPVGVVHYRKVRVASCNVNWSVRGSTACCSWMFPLKVCRCTALPTEVLAMR